MEFGLKLEVSLSVYYGGASRGVAGAGRCGAPKGEKGGIMTTIRREYRGSYAGEGAKAADAMIPSYLAIASKKYIYMALLRRLLQRRCAVVFGARKTTIMDEHSRLP